MKVTVVSGGQTGVDRAALEVALELGLAHTGWCPAGGWAEDLPDPPGLLARYPGLRPTPSADPTLRTRWNVRDSDATLVVLARLDHDSPGTRLTVETATELSRPLLVVSARAQSREREQIRTWIHSLPQALRLNVAGPRESEVSGISTDAAALLREVLRPG